MQEGQPERTVGREMRRRGVEMRAEGEDEQQEEVMRLTRVQNSPGGCHSYNTDPVSKPDSGLQVEIQF